jgi:hypothetical protein
VTNQLEPEECFIRIDCTELSQIHLANYNDVMGKFTSKCQHVIFSSLGNEAHTPVKYPLKAHQKSSTQKQRVENDISNV